MLYAVTITETSSKTVLVDTDTFEKAIEKVEKAYKDEEIVLDYSDFDDYEIDVCNEYPNGIFDETAEDKTDYQIV